jgi:hypothetical protein
MYIPEEWKILYETELIIAGHSYKSSWSLNTDEIKRQNINKTRL